MSNKPCQACLEIPPIKGPDYEAKGNFEEFAGFKSYVVKIEPQPKTGVLVVYDIFGMSTQAKQGADIVAAHKPGHVVVIPDLFHGNPADLKNYPPDTEEKKKVVGQFFETTGNRDKNVEAVKSIIQALKKDSNYSSVEKWGIVGFCWGGKVATTLAGKSDYFQSSAQCHPAFLDAKDVEALSIPHLILASKDEDKDTVQKCKETLEKRGDKSNVKTYSDSIHGWMGARSNLSKEDEKETFANGYKDLVDFFTATL